MALSVSDTRPLPHRVAVAIPWDRAREALRTIPGPNDLSGAHKPNIVGLRSEHVRERLLSGDA